MSRLIPKSEDGDAEIELIQQEDSSHVHEKEGTSLLTTAAYWLLRRSLIDALSIASKKDSDVVLFYDNEKILPKDICCPKVAISSGFPADLLSDAVAVISVTRDNPNGLNGLMSALEANPGCSYISHYPSAAFCRLLGFFGRGKSSLSAPVSYGRKALFRSHRGLACLVSDDLDVREALPPLLIALIICFFLTITFLRGQTLPLDDLARHSKSVLYGYDFRKLFVYSWHPSFNTYVGFDLLASALYRAFGQQSFLLFQLVPLLLTFAALQRLMKGSDDNMISLALLVVFYFISERFLSGRPCVLNSSIFLCTYAFRDEIPEAAHFTIGLVTGFLYYLFFLYTVPFIFVGTRRQRLAYVLSTLCALTGWYIYSGGEYFASIFSLSTSFNLKHGVGYSELSPIFPGGLFTFLPVLIPLFIYWRRDKKRSLVTFYFMLSNQLRFFETITPLAVSFFRYLPLRIGPLAVAAALSLSLLHVHTERHVTLSMPAGSRVLTENSYEMNSVVMDSGRVGVAPSANIGWNDKPVRDAIERMQADGRLDCSLFATHKFDYVVEHCLREVPSCLSLERISGPYRIWKVRNYSGSTAGRGYS
jgi:hypothetical protein